MEDNDMVGNVLATADITVHALFRGLPVCGFSNKSPQNRRSVHTYTDLGDLTKINCPICKKGAERWAQARARTRTEPPPQK